MLPTGRLDGGHRVGSIKVFQHLPLWALAAADPAVAGARGHASAMEAAAARATPHHAPDAGALPDQRPAPTCGHGTHLSGQEQLNSWGDLHHFAPLCSATSEHRERKRTIHAKWHRIGLLTR